MINCHERATLEDLFGGECRVVTDSGPVHVSALHWICPNGEDGGMVEIRVWIDGHAETGVRLTIIDLGGQPKSLIHLGSSRWSDLRAAFSLSACIRHAYKVGIRLEEMFRKSENTKELLEELVTY